MKKVFPFLVTLMAIGFWGVSPLNAQTVTATVGVGTSPYYAGVNATTNKIYVPNYGDDTVSVINGATDTVTATVLVGGGPLYAGVNATTNKIYVPNDDDDSVSVIYDPHGAVPATPIPTLNEWGLIILSLLMIGVGYISIRRRESASV